MIGGYAGAFAIWAATRPQLPDKTNIAVALSLATSLASFVLFEVYRMTSTSIRLLKSRAFILQDFAPEKFLEKLHLFSLEEQKLSLFFMPIWIITMIVSIGGALIAVALLGYNYFALLIGWHCWPA